MPQFRNLLNRKNQANGGDADGFDENHLSPTPALSRFVAVAMVNRTIVNDSGVYLPPSPPEKQSFWHRYPGSTRSSNHRDLVDENEPFSISRESFDSYRRSFDICALSPVAYADAVPSRTSLDSRFSRSPGMSSGRFEKPDPMEEEKFEEVGLNDEAKPKKKGIFARFGDNSDTSQSGTKSTSFGFHIPGRKRGQSGGASELCAMKGPTPTVAERGNELS
ncbi:uncharacterized protein N7477_003244 [Penicillium maclennaniae]|uniref:uncharacterized protein n=1 Tax=Penicillium maclennaniae TaxID=1343394 RepID=UPI00254099BA|nr:uncharacterized protein N7477_003244 [Penicillium maclennaniae]KAJ5677611.1 hypothetical protein N7477_003244 [Penicillium maclennaniae]